MTALQAALAFATLVVIVDPLALAPVFGVLTRDMPQARVRRTALVAVLAGFALLGVAGLAGHAALRAIGARIALVHLVVAAALMALGVLMLLGRAGLDSFGGARRRGPALFPLAFPLIAGPGAAGAMVMFAGKYAGHAGGLAALFAVLAAVGALTHAAFRAAGPLTDRLGPAALRVVTRILGVVLVGAAARFLFEALRDYGVIGAQGGPG